MADDLYDVRNALFLGNFHTAVSESSVARCTSKKPEDVAFFNAERDYLVALAQTGLGQADLVLHEHRSAVHPLLQAARAWAAFMKAPAADGAAALVEMAGDAPDGEKAHVAFLAAAALVHVKDVSAALKLAGTWANQLAAKGGNDRRVLELRSVVVDCLLRLNRVDLAERELDSMKQVDDDAVLTLLASATVNLRQGCNRGPGNHLREATMTLQDLAGRGQSVSLLNMGALVQLAGEGDAAVAEAEQTLVTAQEKKSGDPTTLSNAAVVSAARGKTAEAVQRIVTQAKHAGPNAAWPEAYAAMEQRFADAARTI